MPKKKNENQIIEKEKDKKRYYWFEFILYPQDDSTNKNQYLLDFILRNKFLFPKCVYITHDRDIEPDGSIKKSHVHCIVKLSEKYTIDGILECMVYLNEHQVEPIIHLRQAIAYLTHDTIKAEALNKPKYDKSELRGDFDLVEKIIQNRNTVQKMLREIIKINHYTTDVYDYIEDNFSKEEADKLLTEFESKPAFYQKMCVEEQFKERNQIIKENLQC